MLAYRGVAASGRCCRDRPDHPDGRQTRHGAQGRDTGVSEARVVVVATETPLRRPMRYGHSRLDPADSTSRGPRTISCIRFGEREAGWRDIKQEGGLAGAGGASG